MRIPNFIYRSERVGKNGRAFSLYKIRTLKQNFSGSFATEEGYTRFGKFLRKFKLDELPQILNVLKGDMRLVGPRPELREQIKLVPREIRDILLSIKPGLTSLSSVQFWDEERILNQSTDSFDLYWTKIKPMKIALDVFYVHNRSLFLDLAVIWATIKLLFNAATKRK